MNLISDIISSVGLNPHHNMWLVAVDSLTQSVLDDAYSKTDTLRQVLSKLGEITTRSCKTMKRVAEKQTDCKNFPFKVVCDLTAVRVSCPVEEIKTKLEILSDIVRDNEGFIFVRDPLFIDGGVYRDIIQYVYIYIPEIGYITEVQIGHPMAMLTFSLDSKKRSWISSNKEGKYPGIDLWHDGFYDKFKCYLLAKANRIKDNNKEILTNVLSETVEL